MSLIAGSRQPSPVFFFLRFVSRVLLCLFSGGRLIYVSGHDLDVVQEPRMVVTASPFGSTSRNERRKRGRRTLGRPARMVPEPICPRDQVCSVRQVRVRFAFLK